MHYAANDCKEPSLPIGPVSQIKPLNAGDSVNDGPEQTLALFRREQQRGPTCRWYITSNGSFLHNGMIVRNRSLGFSWTLVGFHRSNHCYLTEINERQLRSFTISFKLGIGWEGWRCLAF